MSSVIIIADTLTRDRPLIKKLQQIEHFFSTQDTYKASVDYYLSHIINNKTEDIVYMLITIQNLLRDDECDPYSKLLTLRFIRQALLNSQGSYAFITLLNAMIAPSVLREIAMFRKEQSSDLRGQFLFGSYGGNKYEADYLRRIGVSVHKIALEMYQSLSQTIATCPYDAYTPSMPSAFQKVNKQLQQQRVKYPQSVTYYSNKETTKIAQSLSNDHATMRASIDTFYRELLQLMDNNQQFYPYCLNILTDIVRTGDRYVVGQVLSYASRILSAQQSQQNNNHQRRVCKVIDIMDSMIRTGDIEIMTRIESELIIQMIEAHEQGRLANAQAVLIKKWAQLNQQYSHKGLAYAELNQLWIKIDNPLTKQQALKYAANCKKMQHNNEIKLTNLQKDSQKFIKICEYIVSNRMANKEDLLIVNQTNQDKQPKQDTKQRIIVLQSQQQEYEPFLFPTDQRRTPKNQMRSNMKANIGNDPSYISPFAKNIKIQTPNQDKRQQLLISDKKNCYHLEIGVGKDRVWEPRQLGRSHRKSNANSSMSQSRKKSQPSINNDKLDKNVESLENQVLLFKAKQRELEQELNKKDQVIKKLKQSNVSVPPMSFTEIQSINSYQTPKRNSSSHASESSKKPLTLESCYSSVNQHSQELYRWKKNLLKRKTLVFSNSHVEVGLITKNAGTSLELEVFFTPFINLSNMDISIQSNCSWLKLINKSKNKEHRDKANAQTQYIIKFVLATVLSRSSFTEGDLQYPLLQLSYQLRTGPVSQPIIKQQKQEPITHQIMLPVGITKTCRSLPMEVKDWKICQQIGHSKQLIKFIDLDRRVCNNFDTFSRYFEHAERMQAEPKTYICKLVSNSIQFYLLLKIMGNNEAMTKIMATTQQEADRSWLELLLNPYSYAFSI